MKKANFKQDAEIKRIYRKAKAVDMEKYRRSKSQRTYHNDSCTADSSQSESGYENW